MSFEVDIDVGDLIVVDPRDEVITALTQERDAAVEHAGAILAMFCDYAINADDDIEAAREIAQTWSSVAMHNAIQIGILVGALRDLQGDRSN